MIYFDRPVAAVTVPLDAPDEDDVGLRVELETEDVVGIQVDAFRARVVASHPRWAALASPELLDEERRDAVAVLVAEVAGLFALYGAGAP